MEKASNSFLEANASYTPSNIKYGPDCNYQHVRIEVAVALSGFAVTILSRGRTNYSAFKLPLNLVTNDSPNFNIRKGTGSAEVLRQCHLIIWDECTMSHRGAMEALDKTLQDIRGNKKSMEGVTLVLLGDFSQTLLVIPRQIRSDEIKAYIKSLDL
uniref:ATP-dependent DNA helicase n=1 Tax=Octopus bimaculoides TaxID=37653 RepID=A0A0L8GD36_OCTBM